ncbi:ABC transporter ATP-binding protein [Clostridium sp. CF012]|uniref:ABC transporter ATP-binding protein n=1 Tax=Clostridium sp. CF012 TaxID=2843319 RepID=UPI001C0BDFA9|nr:ABC transporter ATP-binding protein [Clostridium sp. CF012]MBU3146720.1 ABC transporter ATP-binding protein/permease [Clostridium sp. CF012]
MIKKFISYYGPHKKLFILDMVCAFLVASLDLVFPMVTRNILNEALPQNNIRRVFMFTALLVILYLFKLVFNYIIEYWGHVMGVRMQYEMRKDIFSHLQTLSFKYFDDNKTGHIMSKIINDLMEISELAHHGPEDLFISAVMLIGSFIALCTINVQLTLIVFAALPIMIWFAMSRRIKMAEAFRDVRKEVANVNSNLENSISGIRVSKSFTNEEYEMEKFDEGNEQFKQSRQYAYKYMATFSVGIKFFVDILNVIIIGFGGYFVYKKWINIPDLVAYLLYIQFFMQPIRRLTSFVEQYQSGMAGFERFIELMNIEPEIVDADNAIVLKNVLGDIELKDITFSYNDKTSIISNMSLHVEAGKTLAIVGPSGGGKTTLCHLIPRFYELSDGDILIDGNSIKDVTLQSLRQNIGIVQQEVFLFTGTIKENILYGRSDATDDEIIKAAKDANIHNFITSLSDGYDTNIGERGVKLSGGQKQRMSIARVFLKNPPILILDEATSALDNATEIIIQKSLEKLSKGRTTLVVAHRLSTVRNADEIIVITDQGIQEKGTHSELIEASGIYSKLYNAQFKGYIPDEVV